MADTAESACPQTVFVAEDEEIRRRLIGRVLETRSRVTTLLARDGAEALQIQEQLCDEIDLLVKDVVMLSLGSFEFAALGSPSRRTGSSRWSSGRSSIRRRLDVCR